MALNIIKQTNTNVTFIVQTHSVSLEKSEDTKGLINSRKARDRQHNDQKKKGNSRQTMIYQILQRKLKVRATRCDWQFSYCMFLCTFVTLCILFLSKDFNLYTVFHSIVCNNKYDHTQGRRSRGFKGPLAPTVFAPPQTKMKSS